MREPVPWSPAITCSKFELAMAFKARVWSAGKLVVVVVALGATYLLFAAAAARVALKAREVRVPDLAGRSLDSVGPFLADLGFSLKVDEARRNDPKVPPGHVAAQDPPAGAVARRGRSIRVWLSAARRATFVPALVGETERSAELKLERSGFGGPVVSEIRSNDYPADVVVAQDPLPETRSERIWLLVNRGQQAASYVMPDLIGVNGDRATDLLRAAGFRVSVVGQNPYPGVPAGVVLRQSPRSGFQVSPGQSISLEVSR
jgi:eukaryotic-like serine/threonine-protein kinase